MYQFNWLKRHTENLMNLDSIFQHTASVNWRKQCWWWRGEVRPSRLAGSDFPSPRRDQSGKQGQASVYLAIVAPPTAVTHLTITSLKVNWLLFQRDDNANWVAKHNTRNCCVPLRGGGGQIKWPYNSGRQAWQMLLCVEDCIDISLACQAWALEETYRTGDQMASYRGWMKQLNSGTV